MQVVIVMKMSREVNHIGLALFQQATASFNVADKRNAVNHFNQNFPLSDLLGASWARTPGLPASLGKKNRPCSGENTGGGEGGDRH